MVSTSSIFTRSVAKVDEAAGALMGIVGGKKILSLSKNRLRKLEAEKALAR